MHHAVGVVGDHVDRDHYSYSIGDFNRFLHANPDRVVHGYGHAVVNRDAHRVGYADPDGVVHGYGHAVVHRDAHLVGDSDPDRIGYADPDRVVHGYGHAIVNLDRHPVVDSDPDRIGYADPDRVVHGYGHAFVVGYSNCVRHCHSNAAVCVRLRPDEHLRSPGVAAAGGRAGGDAQPGGVAQRCAAR